MLKIKCSKAYLKINKFWYFLHKIVKSICSKLSYHGTKQYKLTHYFMAENQNINLLEKSINHDIAANKYTNLQEKSTNHDIAASKYTNLQEKSINDPFLVT